MRLVNVLALINGKLVNEPFINSFTHVVFEAKVVKRGDLFIAFNECEIEDAIFNGAYGIIFDKPTQISDNEIAWIKVEDIEDAHKKLLRFRLIEQKVTAYECNQVSLELAKQIITDASLIIIDSNLKNVSKVLWNAEEESTILYSPTLFDANLFTTTIELKPSSNEQITVIDQTLFEISFIYDDKFYERQTISPLFIANLESLLALFKKLGINHRLKKFTTIEHFEAVYVNKNLEVKDFGNSDKVLIFETELNLVESEIEFLQKNALWAKKVYLLPNSYKKKYAHSKNIFFYKTKKELKKLVKDVISNFIYIVGFDKSLLNTMEQRPKQLIMDL